MSTWTRADLPEVPALLQADDEQGDGTRTAALSIALDVVVEHLNRTMIKFPKTDQGRVSYHGFPTGNGYYPGGRYPAWMAQVAPEMARVEQEQRDRAEQAERERDELEAANEQLHREWTAVFIRATHAEAERDELRAVMCAEKNTLVRVDTTTKENQA